MDLRMTLQGHLASWGNGFAQKIPDRAGRWMELWPLAPNRMKAPVRAPGRQLLYEYTEASGSKRTFLAGEVMHIRGLSATGWSATRRLQQARQHV